MKRQRVRRLFTVEVKSRSRATPSLSEAAEASPLINLGIWAETALMREMDRVAGQDAPKAASPIKPSPLQPSTMTSPAPGEQSRRILPNLMEPEPTPLDEPAVMEPEPRLPRVRRVTPRAAKPAAPTVPVFQAFAPAAAAAALPALPPRAPRPGRKEAPALRAGERWKRRLPRACW